MKKIALPEQKCDLIGKYRLVICLYGIIFPILFCNNNLVLD